MRSLILVAGLFVIAFLRRPETLLQPAFWNEDYPVFYAGGGLLEPYRGYLVVLPRLIGALEHLVPWPALLGNAIALAATAVVGTYVASERMAPLLPSSRLRLAAGIFVVVQPAIDELLGSVTYILWWLGLVLLLAAYSAGRPGRLELGIGALASVTGPIAIFATPLHWLRAERRRAAAILTIGAAIQLVTMLLAPRGIGAHIPGEFPTIIARRLVLEPLMGQGLTSIVPASAAIIVAPFVVRALWTLPKALVLAATALLATSLAFSAETAAELLDVGGAQRYFFIPGYLVGLGSLLAVSRGDRIAWPAVALLVMGVVVDLRLPPHP